MAKIIVANKERFECTKWYTRKIVKRLHVSEIKFKKIKVDYPKFYEKRSHRYQKHAMPTQDPHNIPELSIYTIFHLVNDHFLFAHSQKKVATVHQLLPIQLQDCIQVETIYKTSQYANRSTLINYRQLKCYIIIIIIRINTKL